MDNTLSLATPEVFCHEKLTVCLLLVLATALQALF